MLFEPSASERARGISCDYVNALATVHAYLDARVNGTLGVRLGPLEAAVHQHGHVPTYGEYLAERPWAHLADGDTPERRDLDVAVVWLNEQLELGAFYADDAIAAALFAFCRALVRFIQGRGPAPEIPTHGHMERATP